MQHDWQIVDIIERESDARPFCACGRPTAAVWRDGVVWLECTSMADPPKVRLARIARFLTAPVHTHARIIDVPAAAPGRAA